MKNFILFITVIIVITFITFVPSRALAVSGNLKSGWNLISWQNGGQPTAYSALPTGCDQLTYRNAGWFVSWIRGYTTDKSFEAGKNYYVKCSSDTSWTF